MTLPPGVPWLWTQHVQWCSLPGSDARSCGSRSQTRHACSCTESHTNHLSISESIISGLVHFILISTHWGFLPLKQQPNLSINYIHQCKGTAVTKLSQTVSTHFFLNGIKKRSLTCTSVIKIRIRNLNVLIYKHLFLPKCRSKYIIPQYANNGVTKFTWA